MSDKSKGSEKMPRWTRHHLHALLDPRPWWWNLHRTNGGQQFVRCSLCKHDQDVVGYSVRDRPRAEHPLGEDPDIWYVALCHECEPPLPMPFTNARERAAWFTEHQEATGHRITVHDQRKTP